MAVLWLKVKINLHKYRNLKQSENVSFLINEKSWS